MRILVTGATGFLGTALCRRLITDGNTVVAVGSRQADLRNPGALSAFDDQEFDLIYHLAAWTQAGDFCLKHPGEQWIVNQQMNTHLLNWWVNRQPQAKLLSIGTSCAYDPSLPLVEENYLVGTPIDSLYTYAQTKRMLYVGQLALRKQYGLRFATFVPSTLYGPGYHVDGRQMHFIFDLIRKILRGKLYGEPVTLWGDGEQKRELIYLDDFINVMVGLADRLENDLVNVGAGEEFSIRQFAEEICRIVKFDCSAIQFDTGKYVGARSKCLVVTKLSRLIPDVRRTGLQTGLERTIHWFLSERAMLLPEGSS